MSITVGAGGAVSSVGDICSANGGNVKDSSRNTIFNDGGSGGGSGARWDEGDVAAETKGGKDGGNGGGKGQGTTTRYFGESNGTVYMKRHQKNYFNQYVDVENYKRFVEKKPTLRQKI